MYPEDRPVVRRSGKDPDAPGKPPLARAEPSFAQSCEAAHRAGAWPAGALDCDRPDCGCAPLVLLLLAPPLASLQPPSLP